MSSRHRVIAGGLAFGLALSLFSCSAPARVSLERVALPLATTTTAAAPVLSTTTTGPQIPASPPSSRERPGRATGGQGEGFWERLAACEGHDSYYIGYFNFSPDTARTLHINGTESYEIQKAAAQRWAKMVDPGSKSGWPVCWWEAQK